MSEKVSERNARVLAAAVSLALDVGYANITRNAVADRAGVADGSVNNAFGTMEGLRDAVMRKAVDDGHAGIVAQGLAARHPLAVAAPQWLKDRATASLAA